MPKITDLGQPPGLFLVLEGADGSGKSTQFHLLHERLKAAGYDVSIFKFPRYGEPSSYFVERYLNGHYGPAQLINPYSASLFYALDRFEAASKIRQELKAGKIVLADRYVGSNMAHQGSKLNNPVDQRSFFVWEDNLEFYLLKIPRPNLNLFLRVPVEVSVQLMQHQQRLGRTYTDKSHDEHEKDAQHLQKTVETYDLLCQLFPKDFLAIDCTENNQLMSIPRISDKIWGTIKPLLPPPTHSGKSVVVQLPGAAKQASTVTSRKIATNQPKIKAGQHLDLKLEKISLLAIETIRFEPGIRIRLEPTWGSSGRYNYLLPDELDGKLRQTYERYIEKLIGLHKRAKKISTSTSSGSDPSELPKFLSTITPMAATTKLSLRGSVEAVERLSSHLLISPLSELRQLSQKLKEELTQQANPEIKASLFTDKALPESLASILEKIATRRTKPHSQEAQTAESEQLQLLASWPRNELDLLIDSLYPSGSSSQLDDWTYEQKADALVSTMKSSAGKLFKQVHYHFDAIIDRSSLYELVESLNLERPEVSPANPHHGYVLPKTGQAALQEIHSQAFDISAELFSSLVSQSQAVSDHGTLMGHKVRCRFVVNGQSLSKGLSTPSSQLKPLLGLMLEKVQGTHFLIGSYMIKDKGSIKAKLKAKTSDRAPVRSFRSRRSRKSPPK